MRKALCEALVVRSDHPEMLFLTGDLGFMALEPLRESMGQRFINAGVSEQNMMSVAAALAKDGFEVWAYSIAPFCYARPFEQIRNDIAFHHLPVKLIGNGGGYAYGVMGPTHHAIEDYGVLLGLPNLTVFVPAFDEDISTVIGRAGDLPHACYVRLGRGEAPPDYPIPAYSPWRQLIDGEGPLIIAAGPLVGSYIAALTAMPFHLRPRLWVVCEMPITRHPPPDNLLDQIAISSSVNIVEEHVSTGGLGSQLALYLLEHGIHPRIFRHFFARAHHYESYGSQTHLRKLSGLDTSAILAAIGIGAV